MKFAPIVPIPMLDMIKDYDYHMVLAPQCYKEAYGYFYHQQPNFKILDNGVAEGKAMDTNELITWAQILHVNEVIAPDVMHDPYESGKLLVDFVRRTRELDIKVMAVLQATNWVEFDSILETALLLNVASVALPKLLCGHLGHYARIAGAETIRRRSDIPVHCLGSSKHIHEVKELAQQGIVRGIDSAAPVVLGLRNMTLRDAYDWEASHSKVPDYWNQKANHQVEVNLDKYRSWCEATSSAG